MYYNYRNDNATHRAPASLSSSQHIAGPKDTMHHAHSPTMSFPLSAAHQQQVHLRGAGVQGAAGSTHGLGFPSYHAWATDQTPHGHLPPPQQQQAGHVSQAQLQQHRTVGSGANAYPAGLASRSASVSVGAHGLNGPRTSAVPSRSAALTYDDNLLHMLSKPFADSGPRSSVPLHPSSSLSSSPPSAAATEPFGHLPTVAPASNVFDPSEFPTLAGTAPTGPAQPVAQHTVHSAPPPSHTLLPSTSIDSQPHGLNATASNTSAGAGTATHVPSSSLSALGLPAGNGGINNLSSYHDLFSVASYGEGRAKAVDALTGSAASGAEFHIQNEDFPALGGAGSSQTSTAAHVAGSNAISQNIHNVHSPNEKSNHTADVLFDRNTEHGMIGSNVAPARTHVQRPEHGGNGLGGNGHGLHLVNGFDPSDLTNHSNNSMSNLTAGHGGAEHLGHGSGMSPTPKSTTTSNTNSIHMNAFHSHTGMRDGLGHAATNLSSASTALPPSLAGRHLAHVDEAAGVGSQDESTNADSRGGRDKPKSQYTDISNVSRSGMEGLGVGAMMSSNVGDDRTSRNIGLMGHASNMKTESELSDSEKYGMKALLPSVLPLGNGKADNVLSVGLDLTALGLNLNSTEPLHKTFESPWEGGQSGYMDQLHQQLHQQQAQMQQQHHLGGGGINGFGKNKEVEYKLPTCYYMQPPSLRSSHFTKFQLETLFYIFYNMPRDVLQLLAAVELYKRKWRYHKDLKLWFSCDADAMQSSYERGKYVYFDIKSWERRPFHDANQSFIQGLMTEDELNSIDIPSL